MDFADFIFHKVVTQGSVTTQLRGGGMFSNHFITNFPQNMRVRKIENRSILGKDMDKSLWLTSYGPPCRSCMQQTILNITVLNAIT